MAVIWLYLAVVYGIAPSGMHVAAATSEPDNTPAPMAVHHTGQQEQAVRPVGAGAGAGTSAAGLVDTAGASAAGGTVFAGAADAVRVMLLLFLLLGLSMQARLPKVSTPWRAAAVKVCVIVHHVCCAVRFTLPAMHKSCPGAPRMMTAPPPRILGSRYVRAWLATAVQTTGHVR